MIGFFNESMPRARKTTRDLSILRLDGDMYESCFDIINNLYDKLNVGGYLIDDDWHGFPCKIALEVRVNYIFKVLIYLLS